MRTFLIVGAEAAGTAAALREFGLDGRIALLGAEQSAPYDRAAPSKFVLDGSMKPGAASPWMTVARLRASS